MHSIRHGTHPTGVSDLNAVIEAGYPYELAGIVYYVFFVMMSRKRLAATYSKRSRILVVLAAIVMVGCVPFHYANELLGVTAMFTLAIVALLSTLADAVTTRRRPSSPK
jgi:heme A synthase